MLRQIRHFQAVVRNNSPKAAEDCHISQSAISQQVWALERELGFLLLERKNRAFSDAFVNLILTTTPSAVEEDLAVVGLRFRELKQKQEK